MSDLFDRIVILRVGQPGRKDQALEFRSRFFDPQNKIFNEGFRISFKLEKTSDESPNKGEVSIYNLNPQNRAFCEKPPETKTDSDGGKITLANEIELLAGYGGKAKLLFRGTAARVLSRRQGADVITTFEIGDGLEPYQNARLDKSFGPGTSFKDIFSNISSSLGVPLGEVSGIPDGGVLNGLALSGASKDAMNTVTKKLGLTWSIQDGALQVTEKNKSTSQTAVLLTPQTGLIGTPTKKDKGLELVSLLQDSINPGRLIKLQAENLNGVYRCEKVTHEGDTFDKSFYSKIEVAFG